MKFGIFVCVLVVLACHEALCHTGPALLQGNCQPEDVPANDLASCMRIRCNKDKNGVINMSQHLCGISTCSNGKELGIGPHDLTKPFPDCCLPKKCD